MTISIWEKIAGIPWWAYIIVGYVVYAQCLSLKAHTIPINKFIASLTIFMALLSGLSISQIILHPNLINYQINFYLLGAVSIGMLLGYLQFKLAGIKVSMENKKVYFPGSIINFFIGILSLVIIYYVQLHYPLASLLSPPLSILYCALLTGIAGGRLITLALAIKRAQTIVTAL